MTMIRLPAGLFITFCIGSAAIAADWQSLPPMPTAGSEMSAAIPDDIARPVW